MKKKTEKREETIINKKKQKDMVRNGKKQEETRRKCGDHSNTLGVRITALLQTMYFCDCCCCK